MNAGEVVGLTILVIAIVGTAAACACSIDNLLGEIKYIPPCTQTELAKRRRDMLKMQTAAVIERFAVELELNARRVGKY